MSSVNRAKKLTIGVIILTILSLCLCLTTFALAYSIVVVENNIFHSGYVSIDLNNGDPVIEANEFLFEPGMTVQKDFYIKNNSTDDVYYKLYFDNVEGTLAECLKITISRGEKVLYTGTVAEINKNVDAADDILKKNEEKQWFTITFEFPHTVGNDAKKQELCFDLRAEAVQTKNNPNRLFN